MVKKILSIDGGGMYGVVPLEVCIAIEDATGKKLREIFDLLVGTSTGSLIAAAALRGLKGQEAPFGMSAQEIMDEYLARREEIFGEEAENRLNIEIPILDISKYPKYNSDSLKRVINQIFGSGSFVEMEDAQELSIAAYDVTNGKPHFFRSWGEDNKTLIRDAVMASSSAPTTHPLYPIDDTYYTDGGVFAANPAVFALADGMSKWSGEELVLVSLGTGIQKTTSTPGRPEDDIKWWAKNIFNIFLDGQNESAHEAVIQIANEANWLNYFRFDVPLEKPKKADETKLEVLNEARALMSEALRNGQSTEFKRMISLL